MLAINSNQSNSGVRSNVRPNGYKIGTTHLNDKYERLIVVYEELHQLVVEMRSEMGGSCAPPNWLYSPGNNLPPPPAPSVPPLF
jgi:hypothetical protein